MINRIVRIIFGFGIMCFMIAHLQAQNPQKYVREGNKLFDNQEYSKAETSYLKALETDSAFIKGKFNRADALYEQEKYQEAASIFENLTVEDFESNDKAAVWHNLGNSLTQSKAYKEAIEAYKEALRLKPDDLDTKYNLTYALEKLKQQEQQNQDKQQDQNQDQQQDQDQDQQQDQDQDQQQDQNQDQQQDQNQDQQQDNQKRNDKNQKNQQEKENQQDKQQQQPKTQEISGEEAKRMLEALKNNEQETLKKLKRIKAKGEKVETEKDW